MDDALKMTTDYRDGLKDIKLRVRQAQLRNGATVSRGVVVFDY